MNITSPAEGSGVLTAGNNDVTPLGTPGVVFSVTAEPAAADVTVAINNGNSGVTLYEILAKANTNSVTQSLPQGLICPGGIRVVVTGAGGKASVTFQR